MIIKRIKIVNYRQYKEVDLKFSDEKRILLFVGKNGTGKSNFLNAINWCLYDEEPFGVVENKGLKIWSQGCKNNDEILVEIEVGMLDQISTFVFQRKLSVGSSGSRFNVFERKNNVNPNILTNPNSYVNSYLPKEVSNFFLFDGEHITNIFKSKYSTNIQDGINRVAQVDLLDRSIDHLDKMMDDFQAEVGRHIPNVKILNNKVQLMKSRIRILDQQLKENGEKTESLKVEREKMKKEQTKASSAKSLREAYDRLEKQADNLGTEIREIEEEIRDLIYDNYGYISLIPELTRAKELIDKDRKKGVIPPDIKPVLINDLIKLKKCICGIELKHGSKELNNLELVLKEMGEKDKKSAFMDGAFVISAILGDNFCNVKDGLIKRKRNLTEKNKEYQQIQKEMKEKSELLKNLPEGVGDIEETINELSDQIENLQKDIGSKGRERDGLLCNVSENEVSISKMLKEEAKNAKGKENYEKCRQLKVAVEEIHKSVMVKIRKIIFEETNKNFSTLSWKRNIESIDIGEDFEMKVMNKDGADEFGSLSTGERKILGLSFLGALSSISGFKASIFIDNPLGMLDEEVRGNVATTLPKFLPEKQLFIFTLDSYLTKDVEKKFKQSGKDIEKFWLNYKNGITQIEGGRDA
ncbi:MAG: AAA family ATPase [Candidatus Omnitrophica bacterium]|nr:AAA family ATPase [Candidatus Omnitrophota bacterium]